MHILVRDTVFFSSVLPRLPPRPDTTVKSFREAIWVYPEMSTLPGSYNKGQILSVDSKYGVTAGKYGK